MIHCNCPPPPDKTQEDEGYRRRHPAEFCVGLNRLLFCTACFALSLFTSTAHAQPYTLEVISKNGLVVSSSGTDIYCGTTCTQTYSQASSVTLVAYADVGYQFVGWTGTDVCSGSGELTIRVDKDIRCYAVFVPIQPVISDREVAAGQAHTCLLLADGVIYCWGKGDDGILGNGSTADQRLPVAVSGMSTAIHVSLSNNTSCASLFEAPPRCWGNGSAHRLGTGNTDNKSSPATVLEITASVAMGVGAGMTCTLLSDGTVYCWGQNHRGQLGRGGTHSPPHSSPRPVMDISTAVQIDAGEHHSCVLLEDGTIRCWGLGDNGQAGIGIRMRDVTRPRAPLGISTAIKVDTGRNHTCALLSDGSVHCWGEGDNGRLGNGSTDDQLSPAAVSGISTAVDVAGGGTFSCAVLRYGSVRCWGSDASGQLGNGAGVSNSNTPVSVVGLSTAQSIDIGMISDTHSCVVLRSGDVRCWGNNNDGELGNDSTSDSHVPVSVKLPEATGSLSLDDTLNDDIAVVGSLFVVEPRLSSTSSLPSYFSIANKPSWATFSTATGSLYGVPQNTDVGITNDIAITAYRASTSATYSPFSVTVLASVRLRLRLFLEGPLQ